MTEIRVPRSFFRRRPDPRLRLTPEKQGVEAGRLGKDYCPHLDFRRAEDWIAWYQGWRKGYAERLRRLRRQFLLPPAA